MEINDRLWVSRLTLTAFRNHRSTVLELDGRPLVLVGNNGAGKTNLLEAVSLLTPGRGLRNAPLSDLVYQDFAGEMVEASAASPPNIWGIAAEVETPLGVREVGTARDAAKIGAARERRLIKIDGDLRRSQQSLSEVVSAVWLTPQMDGLFRDAASGRRRFLDRLVISFDPEHTGHAQAYEQSMRERTRLLKSGSRDATWLTVLEDSMARHGVAITAARQQMVERLDEIQREQPEGPFPSAAARLEGAVEGWLSEAPAVVAEDRLRAALEQSRERDRQSGGASVGPHRSDLLVQHREKSTPAQFCSTGEQKALLVSLILAHARMVAFDLGAAPLLLLDEIVAHLDVKRREALFAILLELKCQAWMTGTDRNDFEALGSRAQWAEVTAGSVQISF